MSPPEPFFPELGSAEPVELAAAPAAPDAERGWFAAVLPALSVLGMLGFALLSPNLLIIAVTGSLAVLTTVVAVAAGRQQRRRHRQAWQRRSHRYRTHLADQIRVLTESARRQVAYSRAAYPSPQTAVCAARSGDVWGRRPEGDSLTVRLGSGRAPARRAPRLAGGADADGDPELMAAAADVAQRHGAVDDVAITLTLAPGSTTVVSGDVSLLRAIVVNLTRTYGPDVVRVHAIAAPAECRWLGVLPHSGSVGADPLAFRPKLRKKLGEEGVHHVLVLTKPFIVDPADRLSVLELDADQQVAPGRVLASRDGTQTALTPTRPDSVSYSRALAYAEGLSRLKSPSGPLPVDRPVCTTDLLRESHGDALTLPIGVDDDGAPVEIDLREAARGGDGPHGLIVGATGSGKSELLRTLLIAAVHKSPPSELALLLVDYKGGAAFGEFDRLPHTAGLLTNLSSDPSGVDRLCASLRAELRRRQQLLRAAGVDDIESYQRVDREGDQETLPRLLVVVDEYAELIEQSDDVLDVLTSLGRLGRSLGIHLLLSSQRLDDGKLRGLDAHLRFRICLRTFTAAESFSVIGSAVAAELPAAPGWAWLSRDGALVRLRAAIVEEVARAVDGVIDDLQRPSGERVKVASSVRPICLPPLPEVIPLDRLADLATPRRAGVAAIGIVDLPSRGVQEALVVDLTGPAAHLAVAGAPGSGRSTLLTTAVVALAAATPPKDLAIHVITSATSALSGVGGLPHVGTLATSRALAERVIHYIRDEIARRHRAADGWSSRILLVIDDVARVSGDDVLPAALAAIAAEGPSVGVCLAVSCGRWTELRAGLREAIASRYELRLNDAGDSMDPRRARHIGPIPVGRVVSADGCVAQIALPRVDGVDSTYELPHALSELVAALAHRGGPATRPVTLLPSRVAAHTLPRPSEPGRIPVGVTGVHAEPFEISLRPGEHLTVLGNSGSGRSGLLAAIASTAHNSGARLWLIDPRRSLEPVAAVCHDRACDAGAVDRLAHELSASLLQARGDGRGSSWPVTSRSPAGQLLVLDDLDLTAARGPTSALATLADLLPFAAELSLSVVVARRLSGSNRAAFEPFFGRLLEFCESAVVLSGDPGEGPVLGGVRPIPRPPGRGVLVVRGEPAGEIQVASMETADPAAKPPPTSQHLGHFAQREHPNGWM